MFLNEKIKKLRCEKGISIKKMGRLLDSSGSYVRNIENGKRENPQLKLICKTAVILGLSMDELLEGTEFDFSNDEQLKNCDQS